MNVRRFAVVLLVLASCRQQRPAAPPPAVQQVTLPSLPAESPWVGTLATAQAAVDSGRFATADTILAAFERSEPDSPDASESAFWRAMLRADPRNPAFAPADARAALDAYLVTPNPRRRTEATVMLRMLALADSIRALHTAQRSAAETRDRAREEEMQKLRDDLQRTQAELDRIKRRLGSPKP